MGDMGRTGHRRRGIYLLPTLFTVGNLFCGYSSLIQSSTGHLGLAASLIVVAAVLDALDGRIARLTGTTSSFGLEFDSLADIVSFGLAPALLAYHGGLRPLGRIGWLLAFLYVVCAAMRLARFNTQTAAAVDRRHFVGLPSPVAGCVLAALMLVTPDRKGSAWLGIVVAGVVVAVAGLMISRLRYRSFREVGLRDRRSYLQVLPIAAILVAVALQPEGVLFLLCAAYLLSAPTMYVFGVLVGRSRAVRAAAPSARGTEVADEPILR